MTTAPQPTATDTLPSGRVVAIAGPVIDVEFPPHSLPEINGAVEVDPALEGHTEVIVAEVAQQIGDGRVRCICLKATDGLTRGAEVRNLGRGLQVPVGDAVLGHVFNVLGEPLDTDSIGEAEDHWEIHRSAPDFDTLEPRAVPCSRPASRSSTCSSPTCRAARSACSAGPASARPCSSRR